MWLLVVKTEQSQINNWLNDSIKNLIHFDGEIYIIPGRRLDQCSRQPCQHGGSCIQITQHPGYKCRCEGTGFYGRDCKNGKKQENKNCYIKFNFWQ